MGGCDARIPLGFLIHQYIRVIGTVMKSRTLDEKIAMTSRFADRWLTGFANGTLVPVVDQIFPLEHAADAHRHMERAGSLGKVLLSMP